MREAIGNVIRALGKRGVHVNASAIRYWESKGYLHPYRKDGPPHGGHRRYDQKDIGKAHILGLMGNIRDTLVNSTVPHPVKQGGTMAEMVGKLSHTIEAILEDSEVSNDKVIILSKTLETILEFIHIQNELIDGSINMLLKFLQITELVNQLYSDTIGMDSGGEVHGN